MTGPRITTDLTLTEPRITTDLTLTEPRPLDAELEGYAWLPRMLDKARATTAGTAGDYLFGCPIDHTCMARLRVTPALILDLIARHNDDADVLAALQTQGIPPARDAWFDAPSVEHELKHRAYLHVSRPDSLHENGDPRAFARADQGDSTSVIAIDAAPGEHQPPHTHPTDEVVVIHKGCATVWLGALQARIVRAGELVRIPAGHVHSIENTGHEPLHAAAV
jgi:quercetin dioxygenase-like cupin family protein